MRRTVRPVTVALLTAGLLVPAAAAHATTAPTISGPARAGYYATVTLTGTTPQPNQAVTVYLRRAGATSYTAGRHVVSDSSGHYSTSYRESATYAYYAVAGGVRSTAHVTRLLTASCSVSKPAFPKLTLTSEIANATWPDYAAFNATRGGVWAGVAASVIQGRFDIIRWRSGHPVQVLARYAYRHGSYEPAQPGSVDVVGITPRGYVVATVQNPRYNLEDDRFVGYVWRAGHFHRVATGPGWQSVHLVGVTDMGSIVGWVRAGTVAHPLEAVVEWSQTGLYYRKVVPFGPAPRDPVVDGAGDIAYYNADHTWVRVASTGRTRELQPAPGADNVFPQSGGPGSSIYGVSDWQLARWDADTGSGPVVGVAISPHDYSRNGHWAAAVGPRGEVVDGYFGWGRNPQRLLTRAYGAYATVPAQPNVDIAVSGRPGEAVDSHGTLAFTSAKDHLVHFFRCS